VRFISVNDKYDSKKENISAGNINVAFKNLMHDLSAKDISMKVKASQRMKWEKGENIIGHPIFGYIKSATEKYKLVIDEQAAAVVHQIFDMRAKGIKTKDIARTLNENNIPTPNRYAREILNCKRSWKKTNGADIWNSSKVREIISEERYTGKSICGKSHRIGIGIPKYADIPESEWIVKNNAFEAIVSKDMFEKAQIKKKETQSKKSGIITDKKKRIIYGKIRCVCCGMALKRRATQNSVYYFCETPK